MTLNASASTSNAPTSSCSTASTSKTHIWSPDRPELKTESDLLVFLPTLSCMALPHDFVAPHGWYSAHNQTNQTMALGRVSNKSAQPDSSLLAFYGNRAGALKAVATATSLIDLSRLKESLWDELALDDSLTELTLTLDPPTPRVASSSSDESHKESDTTGLSYGWLVHVTCYLQGQECPDFSGLGERWQTCGKQWRYNSPNASLGSIYVEFVA
ncbi:hypothetical protein OIO90_000911 [Microbotryomycetes sp. JL221]|nr:hypothetical protein OIO90_000911 [Microbotryomycetes sp. JL221]